jgi:hypothetical protein
MYEGESRVKGRSQAAQQVFVRGWLYFVGNGYGKVPHKRRKAQLNCKDKHHVSESGRKEDLL